MPAPVNNRASLLGFQKSYAFVIGINNYPKINANLKSAVNDARALASVLKYQQGFDHVELLIEPRPEEDQEALLKELEDIEVKLSADGATFRDLLERIQDPLQEPKINQGDCIVFYYAGHGKPGEFDEGPAGYLLPSDTRPDAAKLNNDSLLPMETVFDALKSLDCHHTLLILDCCFAGKFRQVSKSRNTGWISNLPLYEERFMRYKRERAWQVLVSSGPHQTAADWLGERQELDGNVHSPFAEALLDALEGKAELSAAGKKRGDGVLTSQELFLYLWDKVEKLTNSGKLGENSQYPDLFPMANHKGGQFIFFDPNNKLNFAERVIRNPYKGLKPFDLADSDYFFGRRSVIKTILKKLESTALLVVSGASGSGKSSLVKAGLFPALLHQQGEGNEESWADKPLLVLRPGQRPWSSPTVEIENEDNPGVYTGLQELTKSIVKDKKQLLLLDQYEELFTDGAGEEEKKAFEDKLVELYKIADGHQLKIIITLRSDYEWQLEKSAFGAAFWKKDNISSFLYRLPPMKVEEMREALVRPALEEMYEFETDQLIQIILGEIGYASGALPMLSFTMSRFYEITDKDQRVFTLPNYLTLGGVNGALSKYADEVYKELGKQDSSYQEVMQKLLLRMVKLNDGSYGRRRVYLKPGTERADNFINEFNYLDHQKAAVEIVLKKLQKKQLISASADRVGDYYEPIHDALIQHWTNCKQWILDFGAENLSLQRELWQAVLDSKQPPAPKAPPAYAYEATKEEGKVEEELTSNFSKLWEANAKLLQVIRQITAGAKDFLLSDKKTIIDVALPHIAVEDQAQFIAFWDDCYDKAIIPDLNSIILSGYSGKLLKLCLENGDHWLNKAEAEFILLSWDKRIEDILELKEQRNQAIAAQKKIQQQIEQTLNAVKTANTSGRILKTQVLQGKLELNPQDIHGQLMLTSIILDIAREQEGDEKTAIQRGYYDSDVLREDVLVYIRHQHQLLSPAMQRMPQLRMNEEWVDIAPFEGAPNTITYLQFFLCQSGFLKREKLNYSKGWGIYGYETLAGIRLFQEYARTTDREADQSDIGKPDGIVGPKTWSNILRWSEEDRKNRFSATSPSQTSKEYQKWFQFLKKLKKQKQKHAGIYDRAMETLSVPCDTCKVRDWRTTTDDIAIIGIRRDTGDHIDKRINEDLFILLINGYVYKFWGATAPNAVRTVRKDAAYLVEGQHNYRLAWQNRSNKRRVYRALVPASNGVMVFRDHNQNGKLDAEDRAIGFGTVPEPNRTINFSWGGTSKKNWSGGSSVIVGKTYIDPDDNLIDCSAFSAYNTRQAKSSRTRAAYNVFMDLLTTSITESQHITYTLINERDLKIAPKFFTADYMDKLLSLLAGA